MDSGHILGTTSLMRHYTAIVVQWEIVFKFNEWGTGRDQKEKTT